MSIKIPQAKVCLHVKATDFELVTAFSVTTQVIPGRYRLGDTISKPYVGIELLSDLTLILSVD